eukprot:scaffold168224_cov19-Tisochrysis_lutea.AAC.1
MVQAACAVRRGHDVCQGAFSFSLKIFLSFLVRAQSLRMKWTEADSARILSWGSSAERKCSNGICGQNRSNGDGVGNCSDGVRVRNCNTGDGVENCINGDQGKNCSNGDWVKNRSHGNGDGAWAVRMPCGIVAAAGGVPTQGGFAGSDGWHQPPAAASKGGDAAEDGNAVGHKHLLQQQQQQQLEHHRHHQQQQQQEQQQLLQPRQLGEEVAAIKGADLYGVVEGQVRGPQSYTALAPGGAHRADEHGEQPWSTPAHLGTHGAAGGDAEEGADERCMGGGGAA